MGRVREDTRRNKPCACFKLERAQRNLFDLGPPVHYIHATTTPFCIHPNGSLDLSYSSHRFVMTNRPNRINPTHSRQSLHVRQLFRHQRRIYYYVSLVIAHIIHMPIPQCRKIRRTKPPRIGASFTLPPTFAAPPTLASGPAAILRLYASGSSTFFNPQIPRRRFLRNQTNSQDI